MPSRKERYKRGAETYREQLLAAGLASAGEIAAEWPGSEKNPKRDLDAWIGCYAVLRGMCRVRETRDLEKDAGNARRQAVLDAAISERPETIETTIGPLTVYQKSKVALEEIQCLNLWLASYIDAFRELTETGTRGDIEKINRLLREQSYLQRVIVWIATTEGPGLPYKEQAAEATLPNELAELHPLDFYLIAQAFQRVNVSGFAFLDAQQHNQTRPQWSAFWAGMESETGIPAPRLMRDRGLLSLIASGSERARAHREAEAKAKRERN